MSCCPIQQCSQHLVQIKLPSRSWFYGYVSWFSTQPGDGAKTYITRHGQADWEANFLLFDRFAQTATLPLQYVFADHYRLDVLHVDDEFREVLGRLWLTLLIDAYSRMRSGLVLWPTKTPTSRASREPCATPSGPRPT